MGPAQAAPIESQLIGLQRIAKLLGVSRPSATLYAAQGRFPTVQIEGRTYATVDAVLRYRDQRAEEQKRRTR